MAKCIENEMCEKVWKEAFSLRSHTRSRKTISRSYTLIIELIDNSYTHNAKCEIFAIISTKVLNLRGHLRVYSYMRTTFLREVTENVMSLFNKAVYTGWVHGHCSQCTEEARSNDCLTRCIPDTPLVFLE